jgi:hypothetical protein
MVPLQDVDVVTNNNKRMRIMLRSLNGGYSVSLQELITDGSLAGLYAEFSSPVFKFPDAQTSFEYAIKSLRVFLYYAQDDIKTVNNPCNCELLAVVDQKSVLQLLGLNIDPTVNQ